MQHHTQVLIVGAGPTGLTAALSLRQKGIDCLIIDKRDHPITSSNAAGVQARTLELWEEMGFADRAIALGKQINHVNAYSGDKTLFNVNFSAIPSKYHYILLLPQSETEKLMRDELQKFDVSVHYSHVLTDLAQTNDQVQASIQDANKQVHHITADYVIAADGYHSAVREAVKIPFHATEYDGHFMMMDVTIRNPDFIKEQISLIFHPHGMMAVFPMQQFARVIIEFGHDPEFKDVTDPTLETFSQITKQRCDFPIEYGEQTWQSVFYIHEGVAERYREGRVFLAGDAAHVHSPAGGQGMNLGIQDAVYLTGLMANVINGAAIETLGDYQKNRRPIAQTIVKMSGRMLRAANLENSTLIKLRNTLLPKLVNHKHINHKIATTLAMLVYPK